MAAKKKAKKKPAKKARRKAPSRPKRPVRAKSVRARRAVRTKRPARTKRRAPASARAIPAGPTELDTIKLAYLFRDASPSEIFHALMNSAEHSRFTGDVAQIEARAGGAFTMFKGFISGTVVEMVPDARLVMRWRTNHFPRNNPDSTVELTLTPLADGTRLDLRHLDVPKDQVQFLADGWVKYYFGPLSKHLGKRASVRPPPS